MDKKEKSGVKVGNGTIQDLNGTEYLKSETFIELLNNKEYSNIKKYFTVTDKKGNSKEKQSYLLNLEQFSRWRSATLELATVIIGGKFGEDTFRAIGNLFKKDYNGSETDENGKTQKFTVKYANAKSVILYGVNTKNNGSLFELTAKKASNEKIDDTHRAEYWQLVLVEAKELKNGDYKYTEYTDLKALDKLVKLSDIEINGYLDNDNNFIDYNDIDADFIIDGKKIIKED